MAPGFQRINLYTFALLLGNRVALGSRCRRNNRQDCLNDPLIIRDEADLSGWSGGRDGHTLWD